MENHYDLSRFTKAHEYNFNTALREIRSGRKRSHWMWFIFPQIQGLGFSSTAQYYAIESLGEAAAFLHDPCLGGHLIEISKALLTLPTDDAGEVFGYPDNLKLRSCMTLFAKVEDAPPVFREVLQKYYGGSEDERTNEILNNI